MTRSEFINNIWYNKTTDTVIVINPAIKKAIMLVCPETYEHYVWTWVLNRYTGPRSITRAIWYTTYEINGDTLTYNWRNNCGDVYPIPDCVRKELLLKYCIN